MSSDPSVNKVIITSFAVDFIDVLTSVIVAFLSGSVVMFAQVLEGLADLAATGFLLIGLFRSRRPSDRKHPFGHGLELYFWTMISSMLILGATATLSIYFGWKRFIAPEPVAYFYLALLVLGITILTNGYALRLSWQRLLRGRKLGRIAGIFQKSPLIETKTTLVLDLMGTLASMAGFLALIIYKISGDLRFDGLGAMVIGGFLAIFGFLLLGSIRELIIGRAASEETEALIRQATLRQPEVKKVLDLKTLHLGPEKLLVNAEVNLKGNLTTKEIEGIMDRIKQDIQKEVPLVKHIQVEVETP